MSCDRTAALVLAVEGGGTKTVAWIATCGPDGERVLGRGTAGPSNANAIGFARAAISLRGAIDAAWTDAGLQPATVESACLAMAGVDRDDDRAQVAEWMQKSGLARRVQVVNDAVPLLVAGTPEGWGVALVSGTGSIAVGRNREGETARTGGWGYLMGDEGSAYAIALAGLAAAARAADGRGDAHGLLARFLKRLLLERPEQLIPTIYRGDWDRAALAGLAEVVTTAAEDADPAACSLLDAAGAALAELVANTGRQLNLGDTFPLALTGGIALNAGYVRTRLEAELRRRGLNVVPITPVAEPILGAVRLAAVELV